jgi:hypothetical protein
MPSLAAFQAGGCSQSTLALQSVISAYVMRFRLFRLAGTPRWGDLFSFEFFNSGIAVVNGIPSVNGVDFSAVGCGQFR